MRKILNFNSDWSFTKSSIENLAIVPDGAEKINLPHTWNATDGQDGGNDYHRGTCYYFKEFSKDSLPESDRYYLELNGANSSADVYIGGEHIAHHDGGYSTFRVDLTDKIAENNVITVAVDNAPNDRVYPQVADFTFYGGLYRNVNLICVGNSHFELEYYGTPGLKVTPSVRGEGGEVEIEVYTKAESATFRYTVLDKDGKTVAAVETAEKKANLAVENITLWHGRKNPYLYSAEAELIIEGKVCDKVSANFGFRTFEIDPERGFILNGEEYPLRGVSRHQDRLGIGNALLPEHHEEDINYILELGATTIRLAHYQHDQYFYDLCDKTGLVIWAEIPYISQHMPTARENTISQMKELVIQNYNHTSIVVWGLSNEITMKGDKDPDLIENHKILNDLVHELDKTRLTTIAAVSMCPMDSPYLEISDVVSYNHYFGWYGGDTDMNGPWFDKFHAMHPNIPIGVSEYGQKVKRGTKNVF